MVGLLSCVLCCALQRHQRYVMVDLDHEEDEEATRGLVGGAHTSGGGHGECACRRQHDRGSVWAWAWVSVLWAQSTAASSIMHTCHTLLRWEPRVNSVSTALSPAYLCGMRGG